MLAAKRAPGSQATFPEDMSLFTLNLDDPAAVPMVFESFTNQEVSHYSGCLTMSFYPDTSSPPPPPPPLPGGGHVALVVSSRAEFTCM